MKFSFPIVELLDYDKDWTQLEKDDNVFSIVVMTHLKSIQVKQDDQRKQWKMNLVRNLFQRGWDRTIIIDLLRFIDWVIALPKSLAEEFSIELQQLEKEQQMQYVTSFERIGIEKGELRKAQEDVIEALEIHLDIKAPTEIVNAVNQISDSVQLKELHRKAIKSATLDEFTNYLNQV